MYLDVSRYNVVLNVLILTHVAPAKCSKSGWISSFQSHDLLEIENTLFRYVIGARNIYTYIYYAERTYLPTSLELLVSNFEQVVLYDLGRFRQVLLVCFTFARLGHCVTKESN